MSSIYSAFNLLSNMASRPAILHDIKNSATYNIEITPSNYFRNLVAPEEMTIEAFEFVITKNTLDQASFSGEPKRGMFIEDTTRDNETYTLAVIKPMYILGNLVGYRVRNE